MYWIRLRQNTMLTTFLLLLSVCLTAGHYLDSLPRDDNDKLWTTLNQPYEKLEKYDSLDYDDSDGVIETVKDEIETVRDVIDQLKEKRHHQKKDGVRRSKRRKTKKTKKKEEDEPPLETAQIKMPRVSPNKMDTYYCIAHKLPKGDRYIVKYEPAAKMQIAHHMLMFGCGIPFDTEKHWSCREMAPVCAGGVQSIVYAWGKDAPPLEMPKGVGAHVGGESGVNYLVLQVHYLNVSTFKDGNTDSSGVTVTLDKRKKDRLAGIYLLSGGWPPIEPHLKKSHIDMGCLYPREEDGPTLTAFRFRVHAHKLGSVITAYRVRHNKWKLIGRGDPQKPQAFYRTDHEIKVRPGDTVMGRCTYNSESRNRTTYVGATHEDEMCNFYMMYHYDPKPHGEITYASCEAAKPKYFHEFPIDSDEPKKMVV